MLRSRPEREAMAILHRIRKSDTATALAMVRDGDLLIPILPAPNRASHALPSLKSLTMKGLDDRPWSSGSALSPLEEAFSTPSGAQEGAESHGSDQGRFDPKLYLHRSIPRGKQC